MASDPIVYVIDDDDGARGSLEFLLDCAEIRVRGFASADAFLCFQHAHRNAGLAQTPAGRSKQVLAIDDMALLGFSVRTPKAIQQLRARAEQLP